MVFPRRAPRSPKRVRRRFRPGFEPLERRLALTGDVDRLTPAQVGGLLRGVQVLSEQIAAMQVAGALSEQAVGIAQPIGTLVAVGDELRRGLAEPIARSLAAAVTPDQVVDAFTTAAAADDGPGKANFFSISNASRRQTVENGRTVVWFEMTLAGSRVLPGFTLDVGQRPATAPVTAGQQSLYDRGLRLDPLVVDLTVGFTGAVRFGIDVDPHLAAEQAVLVDLDALRVFARASNTVEGGNPLSAVGASFGPLRLGPASVDVSFDVAAEVDLNGDDPRVLGSLLAQPPASLYEVRPAANASFDVGIPFTLGLAGFTETDSRLRVGIAATGFFHEVTAVAPLDLRLLQDADPGPAVSWRPAVLHTDGGQAFTAAGEFGLAPFAGVTANDIGAYLAALEQFAPRLVSQMPLPLGGGTLGGLFGAGQGIEGRITDMIAAVREPGGQFAFDTVDQLLDLLAAHLTRPGHAVTPQAFGLRWNAATAGLEFQIPIDFSGTRSVVFDGGVLRSGLPAAVPVDVTGRGSATFLVDASGLVLRGGVTRAGAAGLPHRTVNLQSRLADVVGELGAADLLTAAPEFTIGLRDGTQVPVELGGVLPGWLANPATTLDTVVRFLGGLSPKLGAELAGGRIVLTDRSSGQSLFRIAPGTENTITPSTVVGGAPLETPRLSLAAAALGLAVMPTAGGRLEGVSLQVASTQDRVYLAAGAAGQARLTLDADLRAAVSLGSLALSTHPLDAGATPIRSSVTVTPTIGAAVDAADGRITLAELERAGAGAVTLAVAPVSHAGVVQLDVPAAMQRPLGIDPAAYRGAPLANVPASVPATAAVPYLYLAPAAAGATWQCDVRASDKLTQLVSGLATLSPSDLAPMFGAFLDRLDGYSFWRATFPGIGLSLDDIMGLRKVLPAIGGLDLTALGRPTIDDAGGVTWPGPSSFGALAGGFLDTFRQGRAGFAGAIPAERFGRIESLTWELSGLVDEVAGSTAGDPVADLDLVQRIRGWGLAATGELTGLPAAFDGLRNSLGGLTGFVNGLRFGLESFGDRLAAAFQAGLAAAGGQAGALPTIQVVPVNAAVAGQLLFDVTINVGNVVRQLDFDAFDVSVGAVSLPLSIDGQGAISLDFDGTLTTRIGWDLTNRRPLAAPAATTVDVSAALRPTAPADGVPGGFVLQASLGGLARIAVGGTAQGQRPATLKLSDAVGSNAAARFTVNAAGVVDARAHFAADLPLYATTLQNRSLGTATLTATFVTSPAVSFAVVPGFTPASNDIATLLAGLSFDTTAWKDLIRGFMTNLTNDVLGRSLRRLPFIGGLDFSQLSFFTDVGGWLAGLDFTSPATLRQALPAASVIYGPGGGGFVQVNGPAADPLTTFTVAGVADATRGVRILDGNGVVKQGIAKWNDLAISDRVVIDMAVTGGRRIDIVAGGLDLGLPALGIRTTAEARLDLGFELRIGLGYSKQDGFFIHTSGAASGDAAVNELAVTADLRLSAADIMANLGPMRFVASDIRNESELHAELRCDLGGNGDHDLTALPGLLASAAFTGGVKAGLDLDLSADIFGTGNTRASGQTVGLGATLHMGFAAGGDPAGGPVAPGSLADNLYFELSDVGLDVGGLLSGPIQQLMQRINSALKPVKPTLDLLTAEVPVISDLSKRLGQGAVTFLTLIKAYDAEKGRSAERFLTTVRDIVTVADRLSGFAASGRLSLGTLAALDPAVLLGQAPVTKAAFAPADGSGQIEAGDAKNTFDGIRGIGGGGNQLECPVLDDPLGSAFGLLFGKDVNLVTWDIPDLEDVGFGFEQSFPIFPPLFARVFGSVGFGTNLSVGYDTRGIRQALEGDEVRPGRVVNGIFFDDVHGGRDAAEITLTATIGAAAELEAVVAKAGAGGGVRGTIGANFRDPNGDGKVHLDEFKRLYDQSPECIFDFEGAVDAFLNAYLKLGFSTPFGFVTLFSAGMDLLDIRLFDWAAKTCPPRQMALASIVDLWEVQQGDAELLPPNIERVDFLNGPANRGRVLALHMGAWAARDGAEDDADEFEVVRAVDPVTRQPLPGRVVVRGRGRESAAFNEADFDFIWFDGREYQDIVTISPDITKPVLGHGGEGNDRLIGGSGRNFLFGDDGRDRVFGRAAADELHGGGGDDLVIGYGGADTIYGEGGADQLHGDDEVGDMREFKEKNPLYVAGNAGADTIYGGDDGDTITGGDGDDRLLGEELIDDRGGDDTIFGGNGADTIIGDMGNDQLYGDAGDDTIWGDGENDAIPQIMGAASDLIEGGTGANALFGGPGKDYLYASSRALGTDAAAPVARDFPFDAGETGLPVYVSAQATWRPAAANAVIAYASYLDGGADEDILVGTRGADRLSGGFGMDEIRGGLGDDVLVGGPGSDWLVAAGGNARIFGGHGDDVIEGGSGANWIEGGPGDDEIFAGLGADTVFGGSTAYGYASFIKPLAEQGRRAANPTPGSAVIPAEHGGFRTRQTQDPQKSGCEPDVFNHPEVYPESPYTIAVRIFEDLDGDGVDDGEPDAVSNQPWTITVEHLKVEPQDEVIVPEIVSSGGRSIVPGRGGLPAGTYRVTITGDTAIWQSARGPFTTDVTLDAAHPTITLAAGYYRPGRIAGTVLRDRPAAEPVPMANAFVYVDANDNHAFDAGEETDQTDAQGRYRFTDLAPGDHHVRVAIDPGPLRTIPEVRDVRLQSGDVVIDKNFLVAGNVATISGRVLRDPLTGQPPVAMAGVGVFVDVIANGRPDRGEPATVSDASGRYSFPDLPAGSYTLQLDLNPDVATSNPRTRAVRLVGGVDQVDQNFVVSSKALAAAASAPAAAPAAVPGAAAVPRAAASAVAAAAAGGTIRGKVWLHDPAAQSGLEPDLVKDRGERAIAGQTVTLLRLEGGVETVVATAVSNEVDGSFEFPGLAAGSYIVRQTPTKRFLQVTDGGVSAAEDLFVATFRQGPGATGESTLWTFDTTLLGVRRVDAFPEVTVRDVAMFDHQWAFLVGTAAAGGPPGLWRYDIAGDRLTSLGGAEYGTIVALDVLDASRLVAITDAGDVVTYAPKVDQWQRLGRLQTLDNNLLRPIYAVGDLAVVSSREVSFVGYVGSPPDLTSTGSGGPSPARNQAIFRIDVSAAAAVLTATRQAAITLPPVDKPDNLQYLAGLDTTAAGRAFALGSRGSIFASAGLGQPASPAVFQSLGSIGRADGTTFGGLAVVPFEVRPDATRDDFLITLTGSEVAEVGFGDRLLEERLEDGDDLIDGGCDGSIDVLFGDNAVDLPAALASYTISPDVILYGGHDTIRGRGGDDMIDGGMRGDTIYGGDGADAIVGGREAVNWIEGGAGADRIVGGAATDIAYGSEGDDTIATLAGDDLLFGGADRDALDGGLDDDLLVAGAGGGSTGQVVLGGLGDDVIVVRDVTLGGEFAVLPSGVAADTYRGDGGDDTLVLDTSSLPVGQDLAALTLTDATLSAYGIDVALGFELALLTGGAGDNVFDASGFGGRVVMRGNAGSDTLTGGRSNDTIEGGGGDDTLRGGPGDDLLRAGAGGTTRITELPAAGTDVLDLVPLRSAGFVVRVGDAAEGTTLSSVSPAVTVTYANGALERVLLGDGVNRVTLRPNTATTARFEAGMGSDTVAYTDRDGGWAAWAAAVQVDLALGTASGTGGLVGFDNVVGGEGSDVLKGNQLQNRLEGCGGGDQIFGFGGNDTLLGGSGTDFLYGGDNDDSLQAGPGVAGAAQLLAGNLGNDTYECIDAGQTDTILELVGQGVDRMLFAGATPILFSIGNSIAATVGATRVTAVSSAAIDVVRGGLGGDTFRVADGGAFAGRIEGGGNPGGGFANLDALDYSGWTSPVTADFSQVVDLATAGRTTGILGGAVDIRHVIGGSRGDTLTAGRHAVWFEGRDGGDTLTGSTARDLLEGQANDDTIRGGAEADTLAGGPGADSLAGNGGNDTYLFADGFGVDTVLEDAGGGSDAMDFRAVTVPLRVALGSVTATTAAGDRAVHAGNAIERVTGGSAEDLFVMTGPAVTFPGTLDGGGAGNELRYDNADRAVAAAVQAGGRPNVAGAVNFARVVADSNRFTPVSTGGLTGAVAENADPSAVIYLARATDGDVAPGNTITYSIKPGLVDDGGLVAIDPASGAVRLRASANYEAKSAYRFTVVATDAGIPARSVEQSVLVNVLNVAEPKTPPQISSGTSGLFCDEDVPTPFTFPVPPFSDADSPAATPMTVTLRIADGVVAAASAGGVVVAGGPTARTFTGTIAALNAFFTASPGRIVYTPPANVAGQRALTITIAEGPVGGTLASSVSLPVTIRPVNDAPTVDAPAAFTVTEDVAGPLVWPAAVVPVADVDSTQLTVTLTVDAGTIVGVASGDVAVGGTSLARTFRGTAAGLTTYFRQLGRVSFTAPRDNTADRRLKVTVTDGLLSTSVVRPIHVTPVNDPPTLAAVALLAGARRNTPYEIGHQPLLTAASAADVDTPSVSLLVTGVSAGTLQKWTGAAWQAVNPSGATPQRTLAVGQRLRWIPAQDATGKIAAFTIRAWDGIALSAEAARVDVVVDA